MHFDLHRPNSVEEALALYQQTGGVYLAGGTVLLVNHHNGADIGRHLISLEGIRELHGIRETEDGIVIGSCVTMDEIENSSALREHAFSLWQSAAEIGGPQIRNRATIAGNIAGGAPSSDIAAPLLALGALLKLQGPEGSRVLPVKDLFVHVFKTNLLPGELITEIIIPRKTGRVSRFVKVGKRNALAISCINSDLDENCPVDLGLYIRCDSAQLPAKLRLIYSAYLFAQDDTGPVQSAAIYVYVHGQGFVW